jgi:hypothetical protein
MRAGPCSPPCRYSGYGTALVFVSCRHGPKYFVPCRASGHTKRPCYDPPSNRTAQIPALPSSRRCMKTPPFHILVHLLCFPSTWKQSLSQCRQGSSMVTGVSLSPLTNSSEGSLKSQSWKRRKKCQLCGSLKSQLCGSPIHRTFYERLLLFICWLCFRICATIN